MKSLNLKKTSKELKVDILDIDLINKEEQQKLFNDVFFSTLKSFSNIEERDGIINAMVRVYLCRIYFIITIFFIIFLIFALFSAILVLLFPCIIFIQLFLIEEVLS